MTIFMMKQKSALITLASLYLIRIKFIKFKLM